MAREERRRPRTASIDLIKHGRLLTISSACSQPPNNKEGRLQTKGPLPVECFSVEYFSRKRIITTTPHYLEISFFLILKSYIPEQSAIRQVFFSTVELNSLDTGAEINTFKISNAFVE